MKQVCSICGEEDDEYFMERMLTGGGRSKWMYSRCYLSANREVDKSTVMKKRRRKPKKEDDI